VTPTPSSEAARLRMVRQRREGTTPELTLRRALHRRGLRYRVHRRPLPSLRRTVDVVFAGAHVAVDVRGCFWHSCPTHGTKPRANANWWADKLAANRDRDANTEAQLAAAGWELIVVWEHENIEVAADRIACVVRERSTAARA
jgi:DNA mismatch endonuclease (patch repair protein)